MKLSQYTKKILCLSLAVILITGLFVIPFEATATEGDGYIDLSEDLLGDAELLRMFGITDDYGPDMYGADYKISRAEYVVMMVKAMNISAVEGQPDGRFADVESTAASYNYLCVAEDIGLVCVDSDRLFYPDRKITVTEALTYTIRALNYGVVAEAKGGYPIGYVALAMTMRIIPDGIGDYEAELTRSMAVELIANALLCNVAEPTSFGTDEIRLNMEDTTMLEYYWNISKYRGVVTGTYMTEFDEAQSNLSMEQIKIGNEIYETQLNLTSFLGYEVFYFVKKSDSGNEVIYMTKTDRNEITVIDAADLCIPAYDEQRGVLYIQGDKQKAVAIDDSADVVYNGVADYDYKKDIFDIEYGEIIFVNNDKDNGADVVFINEYYSFYVSAHEVNDGVLYSADGKGIDYGRYTESLFCNAEGKEIPAEDVMTGYVVSVFASKNKQFVRIVVSNDSVSGTADKIMEEDGHSIVTISGTKYRVDEECNDISVGLSGIFYLNFNKRIVYFDEQGADGLVYAFAYQGAVDSGFGDGGKLKVIDSNGNRKVVETADDMFVWNGKRRTDSGELYSFKKVYDNSLASGGEFVPQVVKYKLNNDVKIKELYTDAGIENQYDDKLLVKGKTMSSGVYKSSYKSFGGKYYVDTDTVFFVVLKDANGNIVEEDLQTVKYDYFTNDATYSNIVFYDTNEVCVSKAAVLDAISERTTEARYSFIVDSVAEVYENDEAKKAVAGWCRGEYVTWIVKDGIDISDLRQGNVLWVSRNSDGEIFTMGRVFDLNTKKPLSDGTKLNDDAEIAKFYAYYLGNVYAKEGSYVSVDTGSEELVSNLISASTYVYVYDAKQRTKVYVENAASLVPDKGGNGSLVFIRKNSCATRDIIIIK